MKQRIMKVMSDLEELPEKINAARLILITTTANYEKAKQKLETFKAQHVVERGGWSSLGKNESEREMNLQAGLNKNTGYALLSAALDDEALNRDDAREDYDNLCRQFEAVKVKAGLLTAYLGHYPYTGDDALEDELESILGV